MNKKGLALMIIFCLSLLPQCYAVSPYSNIVTNNNNVGTDDGTDDASFDDHYSQTSALAYTAMRIYLNNYDAVNMDPNMKCLKDLKKFFNANNVNCYIDDDHPIKNLAPGDIVALNGDDGRIYMMYIGRDASGNFLLEDYDELIVCNADTFKKIYRKDAIVIDDDGYIQKIEMTTRVYNLDNSTTQFPKSKIVVTNKLGLKGASGTVTYCSVSKKLIEIWNVAASDPYIISLANQITSGKNTNEDKSKAIFAWVDNHIAYEQYKDSKYGPIGTITAKSGNCCDQARLVVALNRAAGVEAIYAHVKSTKKAGGHVWPKTKSNNGHLWIHTDTSTKGSYFGKNPRPNKSFVTYIDLMF